MTEEKPKEKIEKVTTIQQFHMQAAGRALLEFKEAGDPWDAYISLAMILVYLEGVLGVDSKSTLNNIANSYMAIKRNKGLETEIINYISDTILDKKLIIHGSDRRH